MNLKRFARLAPLALLAAAPSLARAEDAPAAPAPTDAKPTVTKRWQFEFNHGPVRRVLVDDGTGADRTYYYMTMTVENKTGLPRPWRPLVTAKVDTRPEPYIAGGFSEALDAIRRAEHDKTLDPMPESGFKEGDAGRLADGAKLNLVAIFGPVDPGWATLRIEVAGLIRATTTLKIEKYGDKQIVLEAAYAERNEKVMEALRAEAKASGSEIPRPVAEYQVVRERRVFAIVYKREGDEFRPDDDPLEFCHERWEVVESKDPNDPNPKVLPIKISTGN